MKKILSSTAVSVLISLFLASPSYAADSITAPSFSPEKNYMVGTNVTIIAAQQNPANLSNFKAVEIRKLVYFYSKVATCSSNPGYIVGNFTEIDIKASGLNTISKTITIPNNDIAGYYLCTYEMLSFSKTTTATWTLLYSQRTGALINAFQVDWSAIAPKIVIIPPIASASESPAPTESATPTASELPSPTGFKATFVSEPSIDDPIQTLVKAWDLKGNEFKARTVKLRLCSDDKCKTVLSTVDVVASNTLNEKTAKTFTMSEKLGAIENYVQVVDALTYRNALLTEDKTVRTYSEVKKLITTTVFPSQSPSATASVAATESATPEFSAEPTSSSASITGIAIGVLSTLLVVALVAIFLIMRNRKNSDEPKADLQD